MQLINMHYTYYELKHAFLYYIITYANTKLIYMVHAFSKTVWAGFIFIIQSY